MLREMAQFILSIAGFFAQFIVSPESITFPFIKMAVSLILLIIFILICWFIPTLFKSKHKAEK